MEFILFQFVYTLLLFDFQKKREEHRALKQSLTGKKAEGKLMDIEAEMRGIEKEMEKEASEKLKEKDDDTTTNNTKKNKKKDGFSRRRRNNKN